MSDILPFFRKVVVVSIEVISKMLPFQHYPAHVAHHWEAGRSLHALSGEERVVLPEIQVQRSQDHRQPYNY